MSVHTLQVQRRWLLSPEASQSRVYLPVLSGSWSASTHIPDALASDDKAPSHLSPASAAPLACLARGATRARVVPP